MNNPQLFAELDDLGTALDPHSTLPPARLRSRVLMAMAENPRRRILPVLHRPTRRFTLAAVATVGLAGVLVAVPTLRVGSAAPPATAQAQEILTHAATAAANAPVLKANKNQFLYIKTYEAYGDGTSKNPKVIREEWLSVDGTRNGRARAVSAKTGAVVFDLPIPGCINGMLAASAPGTDGLDGKPIPCKPTPAYRDDLPTTTAGMYKYLYTIPLRPGVRPTDQEAFVVAGDLIRSSYLPPASLAALFNAVAEIPGVFVRQNVADASGRVGIAVARTEFGGSSALVFDPKTYQFIGEATARAGSGAGGGGGASAGAPVIGSGAPSSVAGSASPSPTNPIDTTSPVGPFTGNSAVLKLAIVDRVGQRP